MKTKLQYYESIRMNYPKEVSKDQFYKIAHISKATALYLLQSGKVPCKDTGKKTRRYTIKTEDIIYYLIDREINPDFYKADEDWYKYRSRGKNPSPRTCREAHRKQFLSIYSSDPKSYRAHIFENLDEFKDVLSVKDVVEFTGYSEPTVLGWIHDANLFALKSENKFWIPKISFAEFYASEYACHINQKPWKHELLIKSFLDKRNQV